MVYKEYPKNSVSIKIENIDENNTYTSIGTKAFLSCKNVYEIMLPDTIGEIGDWAFAHMKELKRLIVPSKSISIGKDVFLDCNNILEIVVYPDESENKGLSFLLASCVTILKSHQLLDFEMASKQNEMWCNLYDNELIKFITSPDEKDFQPYIVGWFNDEGEEEQLRNYVETKKINKIKLCFLRLKFNLYATDETNNKLISYIKKQFMNETSGISLAWEFFKDELSEDIQYVKIAINNDLLDESTKSELIQSINKRNGNREVVAYLLSLEEEKKSIEKQFEL